MKVFRYRNSNYWFLVVFLGIWSGGWMTAIIRNFAHPNVTINDHPATPQQALQFEIFGLIVGTVMSGLFLFLLLYVLNARVEIQFGKLRTYDFLGRRVIDADLSTARIIGGRKSVQAKVTALISTGKGCFKAYQGLSDLQEFLDIVQEQGAANSSNPVISGPLAVRTFTYRGSYYVWFPVLFLGVAFPMFAIAAPHDSQYIGLVILSLVFTGSLLSFSLLKGMNERIELGPEGIVWIGFLGKEKLRAPIDSVRDVRVGAGGQGNISYCRVTTEAGELSFNQYLKGYYELVEELQRIVK